MTTLAQLEEQKRELEAKLDAGDMSAEAALIRLDAAIRARTQKIQHSQQRLAAVKNAVGAGMSVQQAKAVKPKSAAQKKAALLARKPINRFE
jgi:hypothetical protein